MNNVLAVTRRGFMGFIGNGVAAVVIGSNLVLTGCANVYAQISAYTTVGLQAFQSVVDLLAGSGVISPGEGTLIDTAIALVKAAFADIQVAVTNYNNAPADQKSTMLGKISTALADAEASIQTFWSDLKIPDSKMALLVQGLLGVIVATISGFMTQLPQPTPTPVQTKARTLPHRLNVSAKRVTPKEFKKEFNQLLANAGEQKYEIK